MEKVRVFTHRLDLALRLLDTTSGRNIRSFGTVIMFDGKKASFEEKNDNILIFRNIEKRQFLMEIASPDFEPMQMEVDLDALKKGFPLIEIHLVPGEKYPGGTRFCTMKGSIPKIKSISAAKLNDNSILIREYDERKRIAKIFNPHNLYPDRVQYALVDPDNNVYESFVVEKLIDSETLKTIKAPEMEIKNYFRITPLISGIVREDGSYCLRVRDDAETAEWLVRIETEDEVRFFVSDFREKSTEQTEEGGA